MVRCLNCMELYQEGFDVCPHCGYLEGTPPKEIYHLHTGMILGARYTIGTVLGFGGFGITYKAWDNVLEKMIAIKEFYPNGIVNRIPGQSEVIIYTGERANEFQKGKERFLSEARNMAKFNTHPNIVNVYDFFEDNHTAYIAMEFLDGISYKQYISANGGKVDNQVAVEVTLSVLDALKEIHKAKIIHRDISPDNIFICKDGKIKLIDFGAARFTTGDEEKTMSIILKPGYAPPEQYRSKSRQGPWTDIYAVGAVLYRSLTGVMPEESVNRMVQDDLKDPMELDGSIPEYLSNSIARAMALNQELRFQNVDQFRDAIQNKTKILDVKTELKKRKKTRGIGIAIAGGVIAVAAVVCLQAYMDKLQDAQLSRASIEVWYPVKEGDAAADETFRQMLEEYEEAYDNKIKVTLKGIQEVDYQAELEAAAASGALPDMFDSTCLDPSDMDSMASLEEAYQLLNVEEYYFLDAFQANHPDLKQLPLSVQVPVIYANNSMVTVPENITDLDQMAVEGQPGYSVNPDVKAAYEKLYASSLDAGGYQEFKEKETAYYLGDTQDYTMVQRDFAGLYQIVILKDQNLEGRYTDLWSVNGDSPKDEKKAAVRLLYYLLSETSQDIYHVQNSHGIPLNKNIYLMYEETNGDFAELKDCFENLTFSQ